MSEIARFCDENITVIIAGNKTDLDGSRAVSTEEGIEMANHYEHTFIETSALTSENVD